MTRILKALGLSAMAMLAVGVFAASASAVPLFNSEGEPTTLTAHQDATEGNQVFTAAGNSITCKQAAFKGTAKTKTTGEITFEPIETTDKTGEIGYGTCTSFGVSVKVSMNGCNYVFHASGTVDIECDNAGEFITYRAVVFGSECDVKVPAQKNLESVKYTNIGTTTTREITVDATVSNITYGASGPLCGETGADLTNGTYNGKATATGETDPGTTHTGVWWTA